MAISMPRFSTFSAIPSYVSRNFSKILPLTVRSPQFRDGCGKNTWVGYKLQCCYAAAKQQRSGGSPTTKKKKKPSSKNTSKNSIEDDFVIEKSGVGGGGVEVLESPSKSDYTALPLPKPPAGFVLDEQGSVVMVSNKRIATIVNVLEAFV